MKTREIIQIVVIGSVLLGGIGVAVTKLTAKPSSETSISVTVPDFSPAAIRGERVYNNSCLSCHGENGAGSESGPPLVHDIYNPGHHDDSSFYRAVRNGVQRHHWQFGNMPPRPEVSDSEVAYILNYVRELQRANGIRYRQHRM